MNLQQEAKRVIKHNTTPNGITAGSTHFKDVWARDALYASWGAIKQGILQGPRNTLTTLKKHTSKHGQIPLRVGRVSMKRVFLKLPTKVGSVYTNDKTSDPALDPNSLYLITLEKYLQAHKDEELRETKHISAVADWLVERADKDGLLTEGSYASWDDALKKNAPSIYNNALAYAALKAAARLTKNHRYKAAAKRIKQASKKLWSGEYYNAWIDMPVMDVAGNLLAIHTGLADTKETQSILRNLDSYKEQHQDKLPKTNYPRYPRKATYTPFYLVGMGDYHNQGPYWSWVAALEALVREDKREELHKEIAAWVAQSGSIHEIYSQPGRATKRLFYESEKDFSWSAGLILAAKK